MQEPREELLTIVTNVNADTKDRKMAALQILKLYPELKEYRFCTKCGKSAEKFKKTYDGLHGVEFTNLKEAITSIIIYYAHPYSSYERGTNEKTNSLLRRFFPKGKSLEGISNEIVQRVAYYINHLPRKVLNYTYSDDLFNQNVNNL